MGLKFFALLILFGGLSAEAQFSSEVFKSRLKRFTEFAQPLTGKIPLVVDLDPEWEGNLGGCVLHRDRFVISLGAKVNETQNLTADHLDLILCHELGHLLGAAPKKENHLTDAGDWASAEGESDYYSGSCLKKLWGGNENQSRIDRTAEGFFRLLFSFYGKHGHESEPSILRRDPRQVLETNLSYPSLQCRLDSVVSGLRHAPRPRCWHSR